MSSVKDSAPRLLVSAVVRDDAGRVLLTRHAPYYKWHLPDGEVRFGEKMTSALVRSFHEDFHVRLKVDGSQPWLVTETLNEKTGLHVVTHHFRATVAGKWASTPKNRDLEFFWSRTDLLSVHVDHTLRSTLDAVERLRYEGSALEKAP